MRLSLADTAVLAVTLGTKPEPIAIAADPAFRIDIQAGPSCDRLPFELIEEQEVVQRSVMYRVTFEIVGKRSPAIVVSDGRNERRQFLRRLLMLRVILRSSRCWLLLRRRLGLLLVCRVLR